jgi:hypothetical protein
MRLFVILDGHRKVIHRLRKDLQSPALRAEGKSRGVQRIKRTLLKKLYFPFLHAMGLSRCEVGHTVLVEYAE